MRKADYTALASIIHRTRQDARMALLHAQTDEQSRVAEARHQAAIDIAHDFARSASVDRAAFLKACGIP